MKTTTIANIKATIVKNRDRIIAAAQLAISIFLSYMISIISVIAVPVLVIWAVFAAVENIKKVDSPRKCGNLIISMIIIVAKIVTAAISIFEAKKIFFEDLASKTENFDIAFAEYKRKYKSEPDTFSSELEDYGYAIE